MEYRRINWLDIEAKGNVEWLISVSKEIQPALKAIADRHIEDNLPVIIEGDFIHPELSAAFNNPRVKTIFIHEPSCEQILQNYFSREGVEQVHRADVSYAFGNWLKERCEENNISVFESRPWDSLLERVVLSLN